MRFARAGSLRAVGYFFVILLLLTLFWEAYKLLGASDGAYLRGTVPVQAEEGKPTGALCAAVGLCEIELPVRADDRALPHVWDIFATIRGAAATRSY